MSDYYVPAVMGASDGHHEPAFHISVVARVSLPEAVRFASNHSADTLESPCRKGVA
jgi:hypothetical protein